MRRGLWKSDWVQLVRLRNRTNKTKAISADLWISFKIMRTCLVNTFFVSKLLTNLDSFQQFVTLFDDFGCFLTRFDAFGCFWKFVGAFRPF